MSGVGERGQRRKRLGSSDVDYRSLMLGLEKDDEDDEDFEPDEEFETEEEEGFDGQEVEKFDGVEDEEEFDGEGKEESDRVQEEESGGEAEVEFAGNTHLADTEEDSDDIDSMDEDDRVDSEVVEISEDGETHGDEDSGSATTTNEEVGVSVAHAKTLHKKRVPSSQTPLPVAKKRVKRIECSSESSSDEDFGASAGDYEPRNRRSSTRAEKRALEEAHAWVHNVVPPFPTKQLLSWQDFDKELKIYKKKNNLLFRVRSSESTATHNATFIDQIPEKRFKWREKVYRCTHGVYQKSRATGQRKRGARYTGCKARFTPRVVQIEGGAFRIVLRNECHTHNHETTKRLASSYMTTKTLPLDDRGREDVALLADAKISSKYITSFLGERTGCSVSPQQTRNLIRDIIGKESGEERCKRILHEIVQLDGCDVFIMHDQMDVTCGIIFQTGLQRKMFEQWGETIAVDFTHATNNLGYHLGSLVVTTATGRGFPVFDFLCLNQQAPTIDTTLNTFKELNPTWTFVESFVIDKDFVEWRSIEKAFPEAQVLLCQFHLISHWKRLLKRAQFFLTDVQREQLLAHLSNLIYSSTALGYEKARKFLEAYCKRINRIPIFGYFMKNWHSCREKWVNYVRGGFFTAGNTTTNRVESNWNQVKHLLGQKTRIDKTVFGLLEHQITVAEQIMHTITKCVTTSVTVNAVPPFLRNVAARLSPDTFKKVKTEWEQCVVLLKDATCNRKPHTMSQWEIHCAAGKFVCHDLEWTCSCLFYKTHHLPCRHVTLLARTGHKFQCLLGAAVQVRWCVQHARRIQDDLERGIKSLTQLIQRLTLRSPNDLWLPKGDSGGHEGQRVVATASAKQEKQVVYMRLRRNECADRVGLSSSEKYVFAKAIVEPLLEHLSSLPSTEFYDALSAWKEMIETGLGGVRDSEQVHSNLDDNDDDEFSTFRDPADEFATLELMRSMEGMEELNTDFFNEVTSHSDLTKAEIPIAQPKACPDEFGLN